MRETSFVPCVYWKIVVSFLSRSREGGSDALGIGVPVLHDNPFDCVRVPGGNAIAHWGAVILHVDAERLQAEDTEEQFLYMGSEIVEGVIELACIRRIAIAKANVVRRNHVEF